MGVLWVACKALTQFFLKYETEQELSPGSIARLNWCLPIIQALSKCDLTLKVLRFERGGKRGGEG